MTNDVDEPKKKVRSASRRFLAFSIRPPSKVSADGSNDDAQSTKSNTKDVEEGSLVRALHSSTHHKSGPLRKEIIEASESVNRKSSSGSHYPLTTGLKNPIEDDDDNNVENPRASARNFRENTNVRVEQIVASGGKLIPDQTVHDIARGNRVQVVVEAEGGRKIPKQVSRAITNGKTLQETVEASGGREIPVETRRSFTSHKRVEESIVASGGSVIPEQTHRATTNGGRIEEVVEASRGRKILDEPSRDSVANVASSQNVRQRTGQFERKETVEATGGKEIPTSGLQPVENVEALDSTVQNSVATGNGTESLQTSESLSVVRLISENPAVLVEVVEPPGSVRREPSSERKGIDERNADSSSSPLAETKLSVVEARDEECRTLTSLNLANDGGSVSAATQKNVIPTIEKSRTETRDTNAQSNPADANRSASQPAQEVVTPTKTTAEKSRVEDLDASTPSNPGSGGVSVTHHAQNEVTLTEATTENSPAKERATRTSLHSADDGDVRMSEKNPRTKQSTRDISNREAERHQTGGERPPRYQSTNRGPIDRREPYEHQDRRGGHLQHNRHASGRGRWDGPYSTNDTTLQQYPCANHAYEPSSYHRAYRGGGSRHQEYRGRYTEEPYNSSSYRNPNSDYGRHYSHSAPSRYEGPHRNDHGYDYAYNGRDPSTRPHNRSSSVRYEDPPRNDGGYNPRTSRNGPSSSTSPNEDRWTKPNDPGPSEQETSQRESSGDLFGDLFGGDEDGQSTNNGTEKNNSSSPGGWGKHKKLPSWEEPPNGDQQGSSRGGRGQGYRRSNSNNRNFNERDPRRDYRRQDYRQRGKPRTDRRSNSAPGRNNPSKDPSFTIDRTGSKKNAQNGEKRKRFFHEDNQAELEKLSKKSRTDDQPGAMSVTVVKASSSNQNQATENKDAPAGRLVESPSPPRVDAAPVGQLAADVHEKEKNDVQPASEQVQTAGDNLESKKTAIQLLNERMAREMEEEQLEAARVRQDAYEKRKAKEREERRMVRQRARRDGLLAGNAGDEEREVETIIEQPPEALTEPKEVNAPWENWAKPWNGSGRGGGTPDGKVVVNGRLPAGAVKADRPFTMSLSDVKDDPEFAESDRERRGQPRGGRHRGRTKERDGVRHHAMGPVDSAHRARANSLDVWEKRRESVLACSSVVSNRGTGETNNPVGAEDRGNRSTENGPVSGTLAAAENTPVEREITPVTPGVTYNHDCEAVFPYTQLPEKFRWSACRKEMLIEAVAKQLPEPQHYQFQLSLIGDNVRKLLDGDFNDDTWETLSFKAICEETKKANKRAAGKRSRRNKKNKKNFRKYGNHRFDDSHFRGSSSHQAASQMDHSNEPPQNRYPADHRNDPDAAAVTMVPFAGEGRRLDGGRDGSRGGGSRAKNEPSAMAPSTMRYMGANQHRYF